MLLSLLPSVVVLGLAAIAALRFTIVYRSPFENSAERNVAARALAFTAGIQAIHFTEETLTGFPERLGALRGLPAMPMSFFLAFNLAWLAI